MRALFALGIGIVLGTIAALWMAARGDARRPAGAAPTRATPEAPMHDEIAPPDDEPVSAPARPALEEASE
jgi:hypothetical protein